MGFKEVREGDVKAKRELLGVEGDSREQQVGKDGKVGQEMQTVHGKNTRNLLFCIINKQIKNRPFLLYSHITTQTLWLNMCGTLSHQQGNKRFGSSHQLGAS